MNDRNDQNDVDADLEGFESLESEFDDAGQDDASLSGDSAEDADYQDITDEVDTEVFGEAPPSDAKPKSRINWFNIGVVVVAIAGAGGLIWSKMGAGSGAGGDPAAVASQDSAEMAEATQENSTAAVQAAVQPDSAAVQTASGLLDNPDKLATFNQTTSFNPKDEINQPKPADPFAGLEQMPAQAQPETAVPMPAPISGAPQPQQAATTPVAAPELAAMAEPAPAAEPTPQIVQPNPVADTPAPQLETSNADATAADPALKAQVSALEARLNAIDEKLSSGATTLAAPVDDTRLSSIQSSLERLEARLDAISTTKPAPVAREASAPSYEAPAAEQPVRRSTKKTTAKAKPKPTTSPSKWDQPYKPSAGTTQASASSAGSSGWELRGAQTGRAIIAKGGDMREVGVGEVVPGLGEVTGIATVGGRWVVQGTQGRISQ